MHYCGLSSHCAGVMEILLQLHDVFVALLIGLCITASVCVVRAEGKRGELSTGAAPTGWSPHNTATHLHYGFKPWFDMEMMS